MSATEQTATIPMPTQVVLLEVVPVMVVSWVWALGVWLPHLHFNGHELPAYSQDQELTDDDVLRDLFRPRYRSAD